ncbi:MAG: flagellin [Verrucomicrobia bacterium]|nr:flagellin [Verrucomicrobiota bacterium]
MSTINVKMQTLADARELGHINELLGRSLGRLSSGTRISSPADDPAGVGSIAKLEAQSKRTQAAITNVQNAASYVQSSTGFMASMNGILSRMSELTQYAADGLKNAEDISLYQAEFQELQDQLRQTIGGTTAEIGGTTDLTKPLGSFNNLPLYGPNAAGLSIASGSHAGDVIKIPETNLRDGAMLQLFQQDSSGNYSLSVTSAGATQKITDAIGDLADERSMLGGVDSRLELAAGSLAVENQNLYSAVSRIQDTDVATESTRLTKLNILLESGTAILTQANQSPKSVLQLLQA